MREEMNHLRALRIPRHGGAIVGAYALLAFLLFFVSLAIYNLVHGDGIIPSTLWLLLVGAVLFGFYSERGIQKIAIGILGAFACRQFIWATRRVDGCNEIQLGYQIFHRRFIYLSIPVENIERVHWSAGQASHVAGRDVDDWSVALWYEHGGVETSRRPQKRSRADQEIYIVGESGRKDEAAAFGRRVVDFLRDAGTPLLPGKDDCTFVRQTSSIESPN
jgi:hypothetical protein